MPLILDTDLLTLWQLQNQPAAERLRLRIEERPLDGIATTIITFQERIQGWMSVVNQAHTPAKVLLAFRELLHTLRKFCTLKVLPFDYAAQDQFAGLKRQRVRIGTLDLRIASIALALDATLLSRNLRDFRKVPGLRVEDWTQ
jgi:tRNA(fMet)-specific endonuclease VapC